MSVKAETLTVSMECTAEEVYAFVSHPENLPRWATAFCKSVRQSGPDWIMETPEGPATVRFVGKNPFGVLDHYVVPATRVEIYVPMRVVANGAGGSAVVFTLFHPPNMSEEQFRNDLAMVQRDLITLRRVLGG